MLVYCAAFLCFTIIGCKKKDPDCPTCPCPLCPIITDIIPNHGRTGDTILIKGNNFASVPDLNQIYFNDNILTDEIISGSTTELRIIVPAEARSGSLSIRINDENALSSNEIPNYVSPHFTYDHYVELVAGTPEFSGYTDAPVLEAKFSTLNRLEIDNLHNKIFLIDKTNSGSKTIRQISDTDVLTIYTSASIASNYQLYATTCAYEEKIYIAEFDGPNSMSRIRYKNINDNNNLLFTYSSWSYPEVSLNSTICLDQSTGNLYYTITNSFPLSNYLIKRQINSSSLTNDTIVTATDLNLHPSIDLEYKNGFLYYAVRDVSTALYSIIKVSTIPPFEQTIVHSDITSINGIAVDNSNNVYYSSGNRVFQILNTNQSVVIAGSAISGFNTIPSTGPNSKFSNIKDIDFDNSNHLYIVDAGNYCIRRLKID